jgi:hypothetical protein
MKPPRSANRAGAVAAVSSAWLPPRNRRRHKDKVLEYGKDVWMKFTLPTQHVLYFGIQAKKGKLDIAGVSQATNVRAAEIDNLVTMMLGHEIFDSAIGTRVLVDHALIVASGEITKAARNLIGNKVHSTKRRQIMFMDRMTF